MDHSNTSDDSEAVRVISTKEEVELSTTQRQRTLDSPTVADDLIADEKEIQNKRDFILCLLTSFLSCFIVAWEIKAIANAMPQIVSALGGSDLAPWALQAYIAGWLAILPLSGNIAHIFGRQASILCSLLVFSAGTVICGTAQSMEQMVAGRVIQGAGGAGVYNVSFLVVIDIVPLAKVPYFSLSLGRHVHILGQRQLYMLVIAADFTSAAVISPVLVGWMGDHWRWFFWAARVDSVLLPYAAIALAPHRLPLCAIDGLCVLICLRKLKTPSTTWRQRWSRIDWSGNAVFIASTTSLVIGLTWAGSRYPWSSVQVLCPLTLGLAGLASWPFYQRMLRYPTIPLEIFVTRNAWLAEIGSFISWFAAFSFAFHYPLYHQIVRLQAPLSVGVSMIGHGLAAQVAVVTAMLWIHYSQRYRLPIWIGWSFALIGFGFFLTLDARSSTIAWLGSAIVLGFGQGLSWDSYFPAILAALPPSLSGQVTTFTNTVMFAGSLIGTSVGSAILQQRLLKTLPVAVLGRLPPNSDVVFSLPSIIRDLPPELADECREAAASALHVFWLFLLVISAVGFVLSWPVRAAPLHKVTDDSWGLRRRGEEVVKV